jgi:SAM-dependent methyltransferase
MADSPLTGTAEVVRLARVLLEKGRSRFGFADAALERYLATTTAPDSQAHLLGIIASTIGSGDYFSQSRSILEAGCGTGSFLFSALTRGHDAVGIDNDPDRLAVAYAKVDGLGYPQAWKNRLLVGDAEATPFDTGSFDVVLGHQFIEHVDHVPGTISELLRVTKRGGFVVLYAPDYRAPYEAHYEMPWPPFASKGVAEAWVAGMGRPSGGIGNFNYVTLVQLLGIVQVLPCNVVCATIDRPIDPNAINAFDLSSTDAIARTAAAMKSAWASGSLPPHFTSATSLALAIQKR